MILETVRPESGGGAVALRDGIVHFVRGALPGETVEAEVVSDRGRHRFARTVAVLAPSPHRVEPPCPYYGTCGGCRLQHCAYPFQVEMKTRVLAETLRRVGRIEAGAIDATPSEPYGYRARGSFRLDREGVALLRAESHDLVHVDRCLLMAEGINRALPAFRGLAGADAVDALRLVDNGAGTAFAFRERRFDAETASRLSAAGLTGGRFADREWGDPRLVFPLSGLRYAASPGGFLQANRGVNQALVDRVAGWRREAGARRVLDLYAGAGNFALPLAADGCDVVAVEGHEETFRDLVRNIGDNDLAARCRAVRSAVERFKPAGGADLLLLDPPRTGLSPAARALALRIGAPRIAFVSCDPATLARDLSALSARYDVASVSMYDFFPQTHHVEALALLHAR